MREGPGTRASVIAAHLGIRKTAVEHHLRHLAALGKIRIIEGPCRRPVAIEHADAHPVALCPHARAILDLLWTRHCASLQCISDSLGVSKAKARALVRRLEEAGFLWDSRAARARFLPVGDVRPMCGYDLSVAPRTFVAGRCHQRGQLQRLGSLASAGRASPGLP